MQNKIHNWIEIDSKEFLEIKNAHPEWTRDMLLVFEPPMIRWLDFTGIPEGQAPPEPLSFYLRLIAKPETAEFGSIPAEPAKYWKVSGYET